MYNISISNIKAKGVEVNKLVVAIVSGVVIVGAGIGIVLTKKDPSSSAIDTSNIKTGNDAMVAVDACDVLSASVAKKVLGDGAEKGDTSAGTASTDDISVSNCIYTHKSVTTGSVKDQLASIETVGLLVRAAKNKAGAASNQTPFTSAKPAGVQDVTGYGSKAYFNPSTGQLNVLAGNNWYIISRYTGTSVTRATLEQTKVLADAIKDNLK